MPEFAVVVPAYNASATLAETLDAVALQSHADWECVVIDDGSTDHTAAIAQQYCARDARFHLVRQGNTGAAGAYRSGIETSNSPLIVICAADDLLMPDHLARMSQTIRSKPEFDIYSSNGEYLYQEDATRRRVYTGREWELERSLTLLQVIEACFYSVGAVIRRATYASAGGHRDGVYVDDYDLWLRAMARGARHLYVPDVLSVHRVSTFQQSANLGRVYESNIEVYEHLMATETLSTEAVDAAERAIARNRLALTRVDEQRALEAQGRRLRAALVRAVGTGRADTALRALHRVTWLTVPLRRLIARGRSSKRTQA